MGKFAWRIVFIDRPGPASAFGLGGLSFPQPRRGPALSALTAARSARHISGHTDYGTSPSLHRAVALLGVSGEFRAVSAIALGTRRDWFFLDALLLAEKGDQPNHGTARPYAPALFACLNPRF